LKLEEIYTIEVKKKRNNRTNDQNKRLWGYLYPSLSNYFGYTVSELHLLCGFKFLKETRTHNGKSIDVIKSTTDLSIENMITYQQSIEIWATELGWSDVE
jgi:hypothetical protein